MYGQYAYKDYVALNYVGTKLLIYFDRLIKINQKYDVTPLV